MIIRRDAEALKPKKTNIIIQFLSRILKLVFNKIFYVAFSFIIQILWIGLLLARFIGYSRYISLGVEIISLIFVLRILNRKINPSYKLAWSVTIMCIPVFGLLFYLMFGKSRIGTVMQKRFDHLMETSRPYLQENESVRTGLLEEDSSVSRQSVYIREKSGYPLHRNTTAEYFQVGDDMFPVLVRELAKAKHYIFIEYFIINDGVMWQTILKILEKKASQGVDVRLIYDGFGCLSTLPTKYYEKISGKGIKCAVFNPFRPIVNIIQNNRDHRKLCIIDGFVGFTGGVNLSDEYINQKERFGHWKDTAVVLRGEAVWNMTVMFLHMWQIVNRLSEEIDYEYYQPYHFHPEPFEGEGFVQPFSDSPLDSETVGESVYLNIINRARDYVYICTPYLIIDNEMITALSLAAKSGIDVRIMTPGIPDKKIVAMLTHSYYEQLLEAGVRIYEYQPGFLHAKSFVCDDEIAVVGTINLDYRSLYLHFEDGVWLYKDPVIVDVKRDVEETLPYCREMDLQFCKDQKLAVRGLQSLLRVVAPMM